MRYLSLLLLGPWLVILAWAYWSVGKRFRITRLLNAYDIVVVIVALAAACVAALFAFDDIAIQSVGSFGKESGGIWKQVMPALYGYGAFVIVMIVSVVMRLFLRRRESEGVDRNKITEP
jgi:hypothetical protein